MIAPSTQSLIYIANQNANTVAVLDAATNSIVATIPVGAHPFELAANSDGTRVYCTNVGDNTVSVIDTTTNKVTSVIAVGASPVALAVTPNGATAYVSDVGAGSVSVIDLAFSKVTATVQVGGEPRDIAVTPDGSTVYVADRCNVTLTNSDGTLAEEYVDVPRLAGPAGRDHAASASSRGPQGLSSPPHPGQAISPATSRASTDSTSASTICISVPRIDVEEAASISAQRLARWPSRCSGRSTSWRQRQPPDPRR